MRGITFEILISRAIYFVMALFYLWLCSRYLSGDYKVIYNIRFPQTILNTSGEYSGIVRAHYVRETKFLETMIGLGVYAPELEAKFYPNEPVAFPWVVDAYYAFFNLPNKEKELSIKGCAWSYIGDDLIIFQIDPFGNITATVERFEAQFGSHHEFSRGNCQNYIPKENTAVHSIYLHEL